jgi:hypothetical protein
MSKRYLAVAALLTFTVTAGWVLAQQFGDGRVGGGKTTTVQGGTAAPPAPGRYAVAVSDKTSVLLDTATGKSWVLVHSGSRGVWLPTRRLDSDKEADAWREDEKTRFRERTPIEKKEKAQLEDQLQAERARADVERKKATQAQADAQAQRDRAAAEAAKAREAEVRARQALEDAQRRLKELEQKRAKDRPDEPSK